MVNMYDHRYEINERTFINTHSELELTKLKPILTTRSCQCRHPVAIFIHSAAETSGEYYDKRQTLRHTWVETAKQEGICVYFVMGLNRVTRVNHQLVTEANQHKDILQFAFIDHYFNGTLKTIALIRWANKWCQTSRYILKADDDSVINVKLLLNNLFQFKKGISGHLLVKAGVNRDPKHRHYLPVEYMKEDFYPNYTTGSCYLMYDCTVTLEQLIDSYTGPILDHEDLFITGIIAHTYDINRYHNQLIHWTDQCSDVCLYYGYPVVFECSDTQINDWWIHIKTKSIYNSNNTDITTNIPINSTNNTTVVTTDSLITTTLTDIANNTTIKCQNSHDLYFWLSIGGNVVSFFCIIWILCCFLYYKCLSNSKDGINTDTQSYNTHDKSKTKNSYYGSKSSEIRSETNSLVKEREMKENGRKLKVKVGGTVDI
ncbi:beta-1,3-galactosyltransferase 1-like [Oppia nitens]|uniref:beta-1,3-galactosyltransferase 1-like n=1 Tax=Oppia nitens TaxID=1686743 RepID=UPI0023DA60B8|nr:beta-1,3-galactosyltransferase 1-like [Oppia nitens]